MLTNYIYVVRLNEYNIKIKSHFVLKHLMYSTTLYYKLSYHFENDLDIVTTIHLYNSSNTKVIHLLHTTHLLLDFYNTKVIHLLHTTHLLLDFYNTKVFKENKDINITFQNDNS